MADGDLFELVVVGRQANHSILNTFGFAQVGAPAGDPMANIASKFNSLIMTVWKGIHTPDYAVEALWVNPVHPVGAARYELNFAPPEAGTFAGESLPLQDAVVVTWRTALAGRSYRGRSYISSLAESQQNAGTIAAAMITNYQSFCSAMYGGFVTNAAANNARLVVISRYLNKIERPNPIGTAVFSYAVRPTVYSQRRRQLGAGA